MRVNMAVNNREMNAAASKEAADKQAKSANGADGKPVKVYAGALNIGVDRVTEEREKAKEMALSLLRNAFSSDSAMQQAIDDMNNHVQQMKDENVEYAETLEHIEKRRQDLKAGYGVEDGSVEEQELELLRKEKQSQTNFGVQLTDEEKERLRSIKERGLTGYQKEMLNLDDYQSEIQKKFDDNAAAIEEENKLVYGLHQESLKQHEMVDAKKNGEIIMEAANKTIIGILTDEVKDNIDKEAEEVKEKAEESKEEKEQLEQRIESIQEKKAERADDDEMDHMYELDSVMKNIKKGKQEEALSDVKKSLDQVVGELKLTVEDTKGLVVDQEM